METKSYTVVIRKEHCEGRLYLCTGGCPLYNAIEGQIPDFPLYRIGGDYVRDKQDNLWRFNTEFKTGWNVTRMEELEQGFILQHEVTFTLQTKNPHQPTPPIPQPKEKVITKYVSVPETISKQVKELILQ